MAEPAPLQLGKSVAAAGADGLMLPKETENWSLTSLRQRLVKTGGRLVNHASYYRLLLAEAI